MVGWTTAIIIAQSESYMCSASKLKTACKGYYTMKKPSEVPSGHYTCSMLWESRQIKNFTFAYLIFATPMHQWKYSNSEKFLIYGSAVVINSQKLTRKHTGAIGFKNSGHNLGCWGERVKSDSKPINLLLQTWNSEIKVNQFIACDVKHDTPQFMVSTYRVHIQ